MIGSTELVLTCVIISNVYNESFRAPLSHIRVGEQPSQWKNFHKIVKLLPFMEGKLRIPLLLLHLTCEPLLKQPTNTWVSEQNVTLVRSS